MHKNITRKVGKALIAFGMVCILCAASLYAYNTKLEEMATVGSNEVLTEIKKEYEKPTQQTEVKPSYIINPNINMPTKLINYHEYIGEIQIPALNLELPISSEWSYDLLKITTCRYYGSAYTNDLVIAAHNYRNHFGKLSSLRFGDKVIVTDIDQNKFEYQVVEIETLQPTQIEQMTSSENWDLTLFTCNYGGSVRITVRCKLINC